MPQEFFSPKFWNTFGPHPPTLTIKPGTRLRVICPDSGRIMADGSQIPADMMQSDPGCELMEGNPLAGPIFVEGAGRGDALAVDVEAVELDRATGRTWLGPGHGFLPEHQVAPRGDGKTPDTQVPRHMFHWRIDAEAGRATVETPVGDVPLSVKLDPFIGCIGVCPTWGASISALYSGEFGGNIDIPLVRPGTTVYLPIFRDGALLFLGDLHGAQGDGEIIGGAIETSGKVVCRVRVVNGSPITACRFFDGQMLWAQGSHGELREAIRRAYSHLLDWLAAPGVVNRFDLYNHISQAGKVAFGNLIEPPFPAVAGIRIDDLPDELVDALARWIPR